MPLCITSSQVSPDGASAQYPGDVDPLPLTLSPHPVPYSHLQLAMRTRTFTCSLMDAC